MAPLLVAGTAAGFGLTISAAVVASFLAAQASAVAHFFTPLHTVSTSDLPPPEAKATPAATRPTPAMALPPPAP